MIRLIAMDMDGTLLVNEKEGIPRENAEVMREVAALGVTLALCSGRTPEDISFFASDAEFDVPILALNGGYCLDHPHGRCVLDISMRREEAERLHALLSRYPELVYGFFGGETLVLSYDPAQRSDLDLTWGTHLRRPEGKSRVYPSMKGFSALLHRGVNKMVCADSTGSGVLREVRAKIEENLPGLEVSSSWVNNLEVMSRRVNKGRALLSLAASLKISPGEVMALGDADNDISMLRCAGLGIAMGNASPGARAAARFAVRDNAHFGVAEAIRRFVLVPRAERNEEGASIRGRGKE